MAEEMKQQERSIRDILYVIFRHKILIVSIFAIAIIVVGAIILSIPDMYESNAKILVSGGETNPIEMVTGMSGPAEITSEITLLRSRGFAETAVDRISHDEILYVPQDEKGILNALKMIGMRIGITESKTELMKPIKKREEAIKKFSDTLSIGVVPRSNIINLSYQARTPELAQDILSQTIDTYRDKHIEIHTAAISLEFLSEEIERLEKELAKSETELRRFQERVDIVSLSEQITHLLGRIENIQTAIGETEANISATEAAIDSLRQSIDLHDRDQLRDEEIRLKTLNARLEALNNQLIGPTEKLKNLKENERRLLYLQRQVETQEENYRRYLESYEQARIAQTLESQKISGISIMQKPTYIIEPISKERKKILALGLFLGIVGGVGLAFFLEYINHKVKSVEDIETKLSLTHIATIPSVNIKNVYHKVKKEGQKGNKVDLLPPKVLSRNVTVWFYINEEVREGFIDIKNQILNTIKETKKGSTKAPYVLAVTSSYRGEGVSTVATGLAYTIALYEGENVLLVDSNFHHPEEDKVAGINRPPGLYEMSIKPKSPVITGENNFSLFATDINEYLSHIKKSDKIDQLLPSVEKLNYKLIVLDLPSINEGASAIKSSSVVDGMVFVVESERVRREVLVREKDRLLKSGANIFGIILNKRRLYIPQWLYRRF